jgi:hypothetical protein
MSDKTQAETILKMIETVDPTDTAKLDEIDARVAEYTQDQDCEDPHIFQDYLDFRKHGFDVPFYTRSRDALRAIRPERWQFEIRQYPKDWRCSVGKGGFMKRVGSSAETEELAELHAIIQAMEFERHMGDQRAGVR